MDATVGPGRYALGERGQRDRVAKGWATGPQDGIPFGLSTRSEFDRKFGEDLLPGVPEVPGIYRYLDSVGAVIYVGKAKNLRKRLSNYRNATRKKVHRKMRILVREASGLVYETCETEKDALLLESELIRTLKPTYNVDGAFSFLYPFVGVGAWDKHLLLCFTTDPESFGELQLDWFGCFRSRPRAKLTFEALVGLLALLGHQEKSTRLPKAPRVKGSRLVGFRQLPVSVKETLPAYLAGRAPRLVPDMACRLLAKPRALREAGDVEDKLKLLSHFFERDAAPLRKALDAVGESTTVVTQDERDALFIRIREGE